MKKRWHLYLWIVCSFVQIIVAAFLWYDQFGSLDWLHIIGSLACSGKYCLWPLKNQYWFEKHRLSSAIATVYDMIIHLFYGEWLLYVKNWVAVVSFSIYFIIAGLCMLVNRRNLRKRLRKEGTQLDDSNKKIREGKTRDGSVS